jgi:D-tyrosyl-tRNA(Tyr) deacylase
MKTDPAKTMYEQFLQKLGKSYDPSKIQGIKKKEEKKLTTKYSNKMIFILDGEFGAMMLVDIANDGKNVTFYL